MTDSRGPSGGSAGAAEAAAAAPGATATPQKSFAALRHPAFRVYLVGSALAMMADNIEHVISYWIIFEKFHDPALGGFAIISHWLPFLLLSVWAGALADRFDPRRIIQVGMGMFIFVSAAWGVLFFTDALAEWHAAVLLVIHGMAGVIWSPSSQILIHDIVGRDRLQSAVRLMATSRMLGQLMGPAIGAGLLLLFGPALGIAINAAIYLPLVLWLVAAPFGPKFREGGARPARRGVRGLADIVATARQIAPDRTIVGIIALVGLASFIVGNAHQAQMPEFAHDLGAGDAGVRYSVLLAAAAGGALSGGLVLESKGLLAPNPRTAFILVLLWCVAIGGFALTGVYALAVALMFAAGFLNLSFSSMAQTLVQLAAPDEIRGRVIGLYNMSHHGMRAFSGVTVGIGGSIIGIHYSLSFSALALFALTAALFAYVARPRPAAGAAGSG